MVAIFETEVAEVLEYLVELLIVGEIVVLVKDEALVSVEV